MASTNETFKLLRLPREMITLILTFLGPEDLMAVERTSRELSRLARLPWVLRTTRFLISNSADSLRAYLDESRATAISELDLNDFLASNSETVERCASSCVNLTTLRGLHTCLWPTAVVRLLRYKLRCLQFLEWSILECSRPELDVPSFLDILPGYDTTPIFPESLRGMYVEVIPRQRNINFLCFFLERSSSLRKLHCHLWKTGVRIRPRHEAACRVLRSFHDGTAGKFETLTFTHDCAAAALRAEKLALDDADSAVRFPGNLLSLFQAGLKMSWSVIVRGNPRPATNCVVLDRRTVHLVPENFSSLFIVIQDDVFATLEAATRYDWHRRTRALTLVSSPAQAVASTCSAAAIDAAFPELPQRMPQTERA
ncbi:hypothetical protein V5799_018196 [Amblyomma americanum]|uniref:F-box domain-containing protein n=1 Tax=Amblyomma americanum TaxID=6943 RepID=A0AAQ4F0W6_AMBAM